MNTVVIMPESEFHQRVDQILSRLQDAIDDANVDADPELTSGILTINCADGTKVIVNRQTPNREIWVAAKSGGFHFRFDGAQWRNTRADESLAEVLSRVISAQAQQPVALVIDAAFGNA